MSLAAPITISEEANLLKDALDAWATLYGGEARVVSNLRDMWQQASTSSQTPNILICYNGEVSRGSFSQQAVWHRVDRQWLVAVTKGRGYYANRGDSLSDASATEMPLYDVIENVRDTIRGLLTISEETPTVDYKSIKPMQLGNLVVDGYQIEFSTANDIPSNLNTQPV